MPLLDLVAHEHLFRYELKLVTTSELSEREMENVVKEAFVMRGEEKRLQRTYDFK